MARRKNERNRVAVIYLQVDIHSMGIRFKGLMLMRTIT